MILNTFFQNFILIKLYSSIIERYSVQKMNDMNDNPDHFEVLRKIKSKPNSSQRELANDLGFSLGKLNYCLNALKIKGLIKIKNFKKTLISLGMFIF